MEKYLRLLVTLVLAGLPAHAATFVTSDVPPDSSATTDTIRLDPFDITQNDDPSTIEPGSVACSGAGIATDNWFGRVYDLDGDHGVSGLYCVNDLDYALESVTDPTPTRYQVSCVPGGTAGADFVPVALLDAGEVFSVTIDDGPASLEFFTVVLGGCCDADTQDLAIFSTTADCQEIGTCGGYWPGSNSLGQIKPAYLGAPDCGIVDPIQTGLLGFPDMHLIQVVSGDWNYGDGGGDGGDGGDGGGGVPAGGGFGALLTVLVLLGSSAYFMRR